MKKLLVLVSILVISAFVLSGCSTLSNIRKAGDDFMEGLRDSQYEQTWGMLGASLQTELGSYASWISFTTPRTFDKWSFSNVQFQNDRGQLDGECSLGSDAYTLTLVLENANNVWKIVGINIESK
jgi:predicted small secreted protein